MKGLIHSIETFGTVDGPGIRMVLFLTDCPLKCQFCHNPEIAWENRGQRYTPEQVLEKYNKKKQFYQKGGLTFSGGEPLLQAGFVYQCVQLLKENEVHVVIDTSLSCGNQWLEKISPFVDLWMVSIKAVNADLHQQITGHDNSTIINNVTELNRSQANMLIRYVIVPGLTDTEIELNRLAEFLKNLPFTPPLELLAYHSLGLRKWESAGLTYPLTGVPDAGSQDIEQARKTLQARGIDDFLLLSKPKLKKKLKKKQNNLRTTKSCLYKKEAAEADAGTDSVQL